MRFFLNTVPENSNTISASNDNGKNTRIVETKTEDTLDGFLLLLYFINFSLHLITKLILLQGFLHNVYEKP